MAQLFKLSIPSSAYQNVKKFKADSIPKFEDIAHLDTFQKCRYLESYEMPSFDNFSPSDYDQQEKEDHYDFDCKHFVSGDCYYCLLNEYDNDRDYNRVFDCDFSPLFTFTLKSGKIINAIFLACANGDHSIRLWNSENTKLVITLEKHKSIVTCIKWIREGSLTRSFISCDMDNKMILWNIEGHIKRNIRIQTAHTNGIKCLTFSNDYSMFATSGRSRQFLDPDDFLICLWKFKIENIEGRQKIKIINTHRFYEDNEIILISFLQDKLNFISINDQYLNYWDMKTSQKVMTYDFDFNLNDDMINSAALYFSSSNQIYVAISSSLYIHVWNLTTHEYYNCYNLEINQLSDEIITLNFSPDGKYLISSCDQYTFYTNLKTKEIIYKVKTSDVISSFNPEGTKVAICTNAYYEILICDVKQEWKYNLMMIKMCVKREISKSILVQKPRIRIPVEIWEMIVDDYF